MDEKNKKHKGDLTIAMFPKKTLGVLGGMGPLASAEFMTLLAKLAPAECDQEHPKVILLSWPQIPDRTKAILRGGEDPSPYLLEGLSKLASWGADLLAIPCNTAHYFIDRMEADLPKPLIHIVEATLEETKRRTSGGAWLLATSGTIKTELYQKHAPRMGVQLLLPEKSSQEQIQNCIELVKKNDLQGAGSLLKDILSSLSRERDLPFIAACTEIPLAFKAIGKESLMISSLNALALKCISVIYDQKSLCS
ncbi:cysteate racemase [Acetomicrobium thermoterrenum]|nr:amino acid racemase [Acetomicrobium thermoterrenum]